MAVLGVPSGPIGFVAPLTFKILDSQPEKSNMGPVWTDFHDFEHFQKSCRGFPARYLPCFRPGAPKTILSSFLMGTKKMRDEKLPRFVVVSPREVLYLPISCPFKILIFRTFFEGPSRFRASVLLKKYENVYTGCFRQPYSYLFVHAADDLRDESVFNEK